MTDQSYIIADGSRDFAAHDSFTIVTVPITHTLCGDIAYKGQYRDSDVDGDPLAYDASTRIFTADSEDRDLIGNTFDYSVVATLATYPPSVYADVTTVTGTAEISFVDPCLSPFTFVSTAQTDPASDNYSGNAITFGLTEFTITPDYCTISYSCLSVVRQDSADSNIACSDLIVAGELFGETGDVNTLSYSIDSATYQLGQIAPGTYVVTVVGGADNSASSQSRESTYTFTLVDPCDPPTSVTAVVLTDQVYTITENNATPYTHPVFTIDPISCPFAYSYDLGKITNVADASAVTRVDNTFSFDYSQDL